MKQLQIERQSGCTRFLRNGGLVLPLILMVGGGWARQVDQPPDSAVASLADLPLEQLANIEVPSVVGASKYEQKVTQAPASVTILTSDEIKKFGHRTLAEALQSVQGLYVGNDRNYTYLGMRGFSRPGDYNTRFLLLIDGHRANDNIYDSAYVAQDSLVDIDLIERIEVIRGPGSSIYGSSAFFGVINIVTKRGRQLDGAEVSGEIGSFDSYKGRFSYGKRFENDLEFLLSGSWFESAGQTELYYPEFDDRISSDPRARNYGTVNRADEEYARTLFGSLGWHGLTLAGAFNEREKNVPTAAFETVFSDGNFDTTDWRGYLDLRYQGDLGQRTRLSARLFYDYYRYDGIYPYDYTTPPEPPEVTFNKDYVRGEWAGTEWQLTHRLFDRHTLVAGVEYRENFSMIQENYDDVDPPYYYAQEANTGRVVGTYAQAEFVILTNLLVNAGLRYDHYDSFGGTVSPRFALIYSPWERSTFKALAGQAYRAPNVYELYYFMEGYQNANPDLEPEKVQTYEVVYEQYLPANLRLSLSAYIYQIEDLISQRSFDQDGTTVLYFDNLDRIHAKGLELELEHRLPQGLLARASYAIQRAEEDTGAELSNSPRHLVKAGLIAPLYQDKLFASAECQYYSGVKTLQGHQTDGTVLVNFTVFSQKLVKGLEVSAGVYNLFDQELPLPGSGEHLQDVILQDGRSFRAKLTYRF